MNEIDDLIVQARNTRVPEWAIAYAQMATARAIQEQTEQLRRIGDALVPDFELTQPTAGLVDPVSAVRDILGMPPARPHLTAAVPSDEASALGDGDWVPTPEELC